MLGEALVAPARRPGRLGLDEIVKWTAGEGEGAEVARLEEAEQHALDDVTQRRAQQAHGAHAAHSAPV